MPTKRALARIEAAELVDLSSRLAPFFPHPVADLMANEDDEVGTEEQD